MWPKIWPKPSGWPAGYGVQSGRPWTGGTKLELERQEVSGGIGLIQERLEGEWGRPIDRLLEEAEPVEGTPKELQAELEDIVIQLERIGLVNMLAVEEHEEEESARLGFLSEQRDDLIAAHDDLKAAIRKINETAIDLFENTFEKIRENFRATFTRLFEGGEADIWLTDPQDPLESPIEIHASPKGKKTQRIDLLSGGERALTALSLLFGIYLVKPSPFCVLDEVDAPLDGEQHRAIHPTSPGVQGADTIRAHHP